MVPLKETIYYTVKIILKYIFFYRKEHLKPHNLWNIEEPYRKFLSAWSLRIYIRNLLTVNLLSAFLTNALLSQPFYKKIYIYKLVLDRVLSVSITFKNTFENYALCKGRNSKNDFSCITDRDNNKPQMFFMATDDLHTTQRVDISTSAHTCFAH